MDENWPPMTKNITQKVTFNAAPLAVYRALMNSRQHEAFTGQKADISPKVGGKVSCYDGYISGLNVELVPGRRIVQAWRGREWPKGAHSIVTFNFTGRGKKTKLAFEHAGVPAKAAGHIAKGWKFHYWTPLKKYLAARA
jgi:activator of HSP90 ATPase